MIGGFPASTEPRPIAGRAPAFVSSSTPFQQPHNPLALLTHSNSSPSSTPSSTPAKNPKLYKTELCRSWMDSGRCNYGDRCQYAHGDSDKRPVPRHPKYKTEACQSFHKTGYCPYGPRCHFIHNEEAHILASMISAHTATAMAVASQFSFGSPQSPAAVIGSPGGGGYGYYQRRPVNHQVFGFPPLIAGGGYHHHQPLAQTQSVGTWSSFQQELPHHYAAAEMPPRPPTLQWAPALPPAQAVPAPSESSPVAVDSGTESPEMENGGSFCSLDALAAFSQLSIGGKAPASASLAPEESQRRSSDSSLGSNPTGGSAVTPTNSSASSTTADDWSGGGSRRGLAGGEGKASLPPQPSHPARAYKKQPLASTASAGGSFGRLPVFERLSTASGGSLY